MSGRDVGRMRRFGIVAAVVVITASIGWTALTRLSKPAVGASSSLSASVGMGTAMVVRTEVSARQASVGLLGYAGDYTVADESGGGVLTRLPSPGSVIRRGQPLYEVDGAEVRLLYGARPAWRPFQTGISDGPDVLELERNLVALGFDTGHAMTVDRHFTLATAASIDRWQRSLGLAQTGSLDLGEVAFLPGAIRVTAVAATLGTPIGPGTAILSATSTTPIVTVSLDVSSEGLVNRADRVLITLPDGTTTTTGRVTWVSPVAVVESSDGSSSQGQNGPTIPVRIRLNKPRQAAGFDQAPVEVIITRQDHPGVLAVPVTALLARPGGYAVEVVAANARRLVPVSTGLFDDATGIVEVQGPGLEAGMQVEVASG